MRLTRAINLTHGLFLTCLLLAVSLIFNTHATHATSYTVSTNDVSPAVIDSDCTLREAIENINTQPAQTNLDCAAADGVDDTITIPSGSTTLQADLPTITTSMKIVGAGLNQTKVYGGGNVVFNTFGTNTDSLVVSDIMITNFRAPAIQTQGINLALRRVEVDGNGSSATGAITGISVQIPAGQLTFLSEDVYVHDISTADAQVGLIAGIAMLNKGTVNATIRRTTIESIHSAAPSTAAAVGLFGLSGLFDGEGTPSTSNIDYGNITITDISSATQAMGIGMVGIVTGGASAVSGSVKNVTVTNISGTVTASGLIVAAGSFAPEDDYVVNLDFQNVLVAVDGSDDCTFRDASTEYGGTGTASINATSFGGNITGDNTCSTQFTQPTDKNNITNLKDFLGPLSNNGGYVPTMPLLAGSPAIDNGVTVSDLTTDARGVTRPQGAAYDSGAYEYVPPATLASTGQNTQTYLALTAALTLPVLLLFSSHIFNNRKSTNRA